MVRADTKELFTENSSVIISASEAVEAFRRGEMLVLVDDAGRENEGDLIIAAEYATPDMINFMTKYGRGMVCVPVTADRAKELQLQPMLHHNTALLGTAFTVTVDAIEGCTTGISSYDRAATIQALIDPDTKPSDLARPGHIFPLVAAQGGVVVRNGHTEAVVDLAKAAGLTPAGVLCEILDDDGRMARLPRLIEYAKEFHLKIACIEDLVAYRRTHEQLIRKVSSVHLYRNDSDFMLHVYENKYNSDEYHIALVKGSIHENKPVFVRIHSQCLTGDTFHSLRCDCGDQLDTAFSRIMQEDSGVIIYMQQEGRGIGLKDKIRAYELQEQGADTIEANELLGFKADERQYWFAAQILKDLGARNVRMCTNNPRKIDDVVKYGIEVVERIPVAIESNPYNEQYLSTKKKKMGHIL